MSRSAVESLGLIGLPAPIAQLAAQSWDCIIVGAGHNGLACAAYLSRAGKKVLVLEARERIGGACTIEEPFPGVRMSPCAYLAGLLHPLVIEELGLVSAGFNWTPASNGLFVPFEDGDAVQFWDDDALCEAEIARLSPADVAGWHAMSDVIRRARDVIRPANSQDMWIGPAPSPDTLDERIGNDPDIRNLLFKWSMAEFVEHYLQDERLQTAYLGQGVIGTNASPFDPGTASIRFHHASGRLGGLPGTWGYVHGGMGMVSFFLADVARQSGATIACGCACRGNTAWRRASSSKAAISFVPPSSSPMLIRASPCVCWARMQIRAWQQKVESIPIQGCTLKLNVWLRELPNFRARPGT